MLAYIRIFFSQEKVLVGTYLFIFILHLLSHLIPVGWLILPNLFFAAGIPFFIFNNMPYPTNIIYEQFIYLSIYLFIYLSIYLFTKMITKNNVLIQRRLFYYVLYIFYTINFFLLEFEFLGKQSLLFSLIWSTPILLIYIFNVDIETIKKFLFE